MPMGHGCRCVWSGDVVQWRIAYLLSVAMSLDDDTCQSLIEAVKFVFADCGITFYQPPHKHHFGSVEDFDIHAEEIWNDIRSKARSQSRTARLYFSVVKGKRKGRVFI